MEARSGNTELEMRYPVSEHAHVQSPKASYSVHEAGVGQGQRIPAASMGL